MESRTVAKIDHGGKKYVIFVPDPPGEDSHHIRHTRRQPVASGTITPVVEQHTPSKTKTAKQRAGAQRRQRGRRQRRRERIAESKYKTPRWIREMQSGWFEVDWDVAKCCPVLEKTGMALREQDFRLHDFRLHDGIPMQLHQCDLDGCFGVARYFRYLKDALNFAFGLYGMYYNGSTSEWPMDVLAEMGLFFETYEFVAYMGRLADSVGTLSLMLPPELGMPWQVKQARIEKERTKEDQLAPLTTRMLDNMGFEDVCLYIALWDKKS
ncbi:hypothetical protein MKZ38_002293 [Zalerion maritima]|uniref:Uncharacterized protein n=1 Tax=Zalerion maritima TaxID=339359 RepID=A0AAD5RP32_9PEZI|nr:hypothetical protein MKZ38_002293 [Zalerion maritima]